MLDLLAIALLAAIPADLEMHFISPAPDAELGRIVPKAGETVSLRIERGGEPIAGALLEATRMPGSKVEERIEVGRTRDDGTIEWTPRAAGLFTLKATFERTIDGEPEVASASESIAVRFARFPWQGVVVMLFAGTLLFGGVIYAFRKLIS